ncbi:MAG: transglycosylase domain-containing protein, partial [Actinomycetes bacterium]
MPESPKGRRPRRTGWRRLVPRWPVVLGTILAGLIVVLGLFFIGYATVDVPDPTALSKAQATTVYYSDGKTPLGRFGDINRQNVTLDQVPVSVQHAVIAAENRTFYTDNGISPTSIVRALWVNLRGGSTQGASTITQQYVKNTYLTQDRTWKRKLREFFITIKVDKELSKQQILIDYLNTIYFGRGAYGIQAAARAYFGQDVSKLDAAQGAVLAATISQPSYYDPAVNESAAKSRWRYVIDGMVSQHWLTSSQASSLSYPEVQAPDKTQGSTCTKWKAFICAAVRDALAKDGFDSARLDAGGYRVVTTIDKTDQLAAVNAMKS